ncbi:Di-copper centre-containing protein [Aaosphaeria arxii CBS 175.79]|uniref:Di-copper centre-containing protein n=1 Tax=Aaosphaeria arxii CBS 175.79 TaxID=1450172 RepID=A0A6A5X7U0_9PLEO|nr:Di-copper centre-containing protein [Aaosphaeria arxii CBS 175.79]KAF2008959.1 Di-copper centre-containing protein [Aaosphaeria arxii CBS 175.79]
MAKLVGVFLFYLFAVCATAACTTKGKRRAWHTFSNTEKLAYIDAELCLMKKPATLGLPSTKTRFDEFQAIHALQAYATHFVGAFLPFHRAILHAHEQALRTECGYTDWQPYWQEQRDAGKFKSSVIFDPVYGFGGDGSGSRRCITTGPFANYTNSLGPGYSNTNHCIDRQINDMISQGSSQQNVDSCLAKKDWVSAWNCIEASPHGGGHAGVGGQMQNGVSSPGDPLFYLHHTWLDKIWWDWQAKDKTARIKEMGGTNIAPENNPGFPARPPSIPRPTGAEGDPGTTTTLNHVLNMYGNGPNRTIADVMDIGGDILCYDYVNPA